MSTAGSTTDRTWTDVVLLLFFCFRSKGKVSIHCHASSPKAAAAAAAEPRRPGPPFFDPAKQPAAAAALQDLDDMFCFTGGALANKKKFQFSSGSSSGGGGGGGGFIAPRKDKEAASDVAPEASAPAAGTVVKLAPAGVEPAFCTTFPAKAKAPTRDGERMNGGGGAGGDRGKNKLPLGEIENGARMSSLQQEQPPSKPSYRRKNSGAAPHAPPLSGRVAIVPRRSVDSAAKPAPPPPTGSPAARQPQLLRSSSSGSSSNSNSSASLTSLASDGDGGNYSRGSVSLGGGSSTARRASAGGRRRRRPVVLSADMPEKLQQDALECTARAIDESSDHEDIAASIKKHFDGLHGAKWHCIVGRHFGSFVTAESNHFVHLYLGKVAVLLFKAGA